MLLGFNLTYIRVFEKCFVTSDILYFADFSCSFFPFFYVRAVAIMITQGDS